MNRELADEVQESKEGGGGHQKTPKGSSKEAPHAKQVRHCERKAERDAERNAERNEGRGEERER